MRSSERIAFWALALSNSAGLAWAQHPSIVPSNQPLVTFSGTIEPILDERPGTISIPATGVSRQTTQPAQPESAPRLFFPAARSLIKGLSPASHNDVEKSGEEGEKTGLSRLLKVSFPDRLWPTPAMEQAPPPPELIPPEPAPAYSPPPAACDGCTQSPPYVQQVSPQSDSKGKSIRFPMARSWWDKATR